MALGIKTVAFNITTGTGTQDVTDAGITSTPVAVIVFYSGETSATDAITSTLDIQGGIGMATSSTNRRCAMFYEDDAQAAADSAVYTSESAFIYAAANSGLTDGIADFNSFLATGMRLDIDNQFSIALRCVAVFFFGTDITAAKCGTITEPNTTGVQSHTGFGMDNADIAFVVSHGATAAQLDTLAANGQIGFGVGNATDNWVVTGVSVDGVTTMDTYSYTSDAGCLARLGGSVFAEAAFSAGITDGIQLNWRESNSATRTHFALLLKGGNWKVGDFLSQTDTSTLSSVTTTGIVAGGILASAGKAKSTLDTLDANHLISLGGFDSTTSRAAIAWQDEDNTADSECAVAVEHDAVYININTSEAVQGLMDVSAIGGASGVDFIMDDADPSQAFIGYVVGSQAPAGGSSIAAISSGYHLMGIR